jgi:hypothetical protein
VVRAGSVLHALASDQVLPFLNRSYSAQEISILVEALHGERLKTLGFNPQRADEITVKALLAHPSVRNGEMHMVATAVTAPRSLHELCGQGVKNILYAGDLAEISRRELARCDLFVPIASDPGTIASISRWLDDRRLPKIIKTYLAAGGDSSRALNPEELRLIVEQHRDCSFIHFGGVREENLQTYRGSGALALGVNLGILEPLLADRARLMERVRRSLLKKMD